MSRITASQLGRALKCPASVVLPRYDVETEAAERGTAVHAFLEQVPSIGRDAALANVPERFVPLCEAIELKGLPVGLAPEVTFAFDVATGRARELGRGLQRDYTRATPSEIVGTTDVLGVSPDAVFVADWKTGWSEGEPATTNPQVRFLAMAAARVYRRDQAIVEIIRIRDNGAAWRDRAVLDVFDLDETAASMRDLAMHVKQMVGVRDVPANQGPWCQHCPAFAACPAKTALLKRLADGSEADTLELMLPLTPQMASLAYSRWKLAKQLLKRVEAALHEFASHEPIDIGDGRWFGRVMQEGNEQLDGDVVWQVLRDQHGREVADAAVQRAATKSGVREALRSTLTEPRQLANTERAVLAEVRRRGGATRPMRTTVSEYSAADDTGGDRA